MIYLLHQLVEQSANRFPEKPAFVYEGESISYQQLHQRSNGAAQALITNGVKKGDRVGVLMPKSLNMPIGLYGVLKAGAVAVPIDPQMPVERLAAVLKDAGIQALITAPEVLGVVEKLSARPDLAIRFVLGVENAGQLSGRCMSFEAAAKTDRTPIVHMVEDDPAYMLFTSGSTGQPKGILHSHCSGLAYARLAAETYNLNAQDRLANFAPLHFDQSTFDFYAGPLRGACTVMVPQAFGIATESLARLICEEQITIWYSVPSILVQLVTRDALEGKDLNSLRWVLFGGEPFPPKHLKRLIAILPGAQFSNVYGPTEVNQCTQYTVEQGWAGQDDIPIGKPWANTEALVVDDSDQPVEPESIGELLIRSPTMMLGYWQRPDLNEIAFYERQEPGGSTSRFYRTGDLVRVNSSGNLEFIGRRDRQVKSRGYRVELDEIEAVLCLHDQVLEAGSFAVKNDAQSTEIEAAVVTQDSALTDRVLLKHCAIHLPAYARPRRITILSALPKTRTGKIDRKALEANSRQADHSGSAAR